MSVDDARMQGEVDFSPSQDRDVASNQAQNGHVSEQPISNAPANETLIAPDLRIDPKDIKFKSTDIENKDKSDLFVNVDKTALAKQEAAAKKLQERKIRAEKRARRKQANAIKAKKIKFFFFGKWHKFITIFVLLLLAAGIVVLFLWLNTWKPAQEAETKAAEAVKADNKEYISNVKSADEFTGKLEDIYKSDVANPLEEAEKYADETISATNGELVVPLSSAYADFLVTHTVKYDKAIEILDKVDGKTSNLNYLSSYYLSYYKVYKAKGDTAKADEYMDKYKEVQKQFPTYHPCENGDNTCDD